MGTRADFYVGRGLGAEWLGSIAWDGHPDGDASPVLGAPSADAFRSMVAELLSQRDDATLPDMGWPWPWADSDTTDYAYAYDDGGVWCANFGHGWMTPAEAIDPGHESDDEKSCIFPDMTSRKRVTFGPRSGIMMLRGG